MQPWQETFGQLAAKYIERSQGRLNQIIDLIQKLSLIPHNADIIAKLKNEFHWLAGSGSVYGFPKITQLGAIGEQYCEVLLQGKQSNNQLDCQHFQGVINGIRSEFVNKQSPHAVPNVSVHKTVNKITEEPYRILSVEDDPDQAAFLKAVLQLAGYQVRVCSQPKHFADELTEYNPDLILMDMVLPGTSGDKLTQYVRSQERYATLPIVFLTSEQELEDKIKAAEAGGDGYLAKPVLPPLLCATVASRLERARFLKSLLHKDGLTGVLTHSALMDRAEACVAACKRNFDKTAALIMIDIDQLKKINDNYGSQMGDKVLLTLADLLRRWLRQNDAVGRISGDEFLVVAKDLNQNGAEKLTKRLLKDFSKQKFATAQGQTIHATFSAGISILDAKTMDLHSWLSAVETALQAAKVKGMNCIYAG